MSIINASTTGSATSVTTPSVTASSVTASSVTAPSVSTAPAPAVTGTAAVPLIRRSSTAGSLLTNLGPLAELAGLWVGTGFNLIARPDFSARSQPPNPGEPSHLFLELNFTVESLKFDTISSPIPNRSFDQGDIELYGLHYLQQISDRNTNGALHLEPGIWVNIPSTTAPVETASVARMASIPHGTVLLAEGTAVTTPGPPVIPPANTVPFGVGAPTPAPGDSVDNPFAPYDLADLGPASGFRSPAAQVPGLTQGMIDDPNSILRSANEGFTIIETTRLDIATVASQSVLDAASPPPPAVQPGSTTAAIADGGGGTRNLPFLNRNASAETVFATFWIERVQDPFFPGRSFTQLQYSQTVLLNFPVDIPPSATNPAGLVPLSWPHVSVATLTKDF